VQKKENKINQAGKGTHAVIAKRKPDEALSFHSSLGPRVSSSSIKFLSIMRQLMEEI
jgi:hypothetical protein